MVLSYEFCSVRSAQLAQQEWMQHQARARKSGSLTGQSHNHCLGSFSLAHTPSLSDKDPTAMKPNALV